MAGFDPDTLLDHLQLVSPEDKSSKLLHEAIVAPPTVELSIDGASTLTIPVTDPTRRLARSDVFITKSWATALGVNFELVKAAKTGDDVTLTFEDAIAAQLRRQTKKLRIPAGSSTRREIVTRLAREAGVKHAIDPDKRKKVRNAVERTDGASSWDVTGSLASEINWRRFTDGKRLVVGSDEWLMSKDTKPTKLREHTGPVGDIDFDLDVGKKAPTLTLELDAEYGALTIGSVCLIEDEFPATEGKWITAGYTHELTSSIATLELTRSQHVLKEPKGTGGPGEKGEDGFVPDREGDDPGPASSSSTTAASNPARERMVQFALAQAGDSYVWGGNGPSGWDCSGLVQAATAAAGKTLTKPSKSQWATCVNAGVTIPVAEALRIRGALLFNMSGEPTHVAISLGNGSTIEAMGSAYGVLVAGGAASRGWTGGALWI